MVRSGKNRSFVPVARGGDTHDLPLRKERTRRHIPIADALRRLGEPSAELEQLGIVPAALEAGAKIRLARLNKGLTQARLAGMAGISQPALSDIENGKGTDGPSYATLREIARALEFDLMPIGEKLEPEDIELSVKTVSDGVDAETPEEDVSELANASLVLRSLIDTRLFDAMRAWMTASKVTPPLLGGPDVSRLLTVSGHQSAQVFVDPMTTLVMHGNGQFISAHQGVRVDPFNYGGTNQQVAMVQKGGLLEMQNHGTETVLVFAVSPQTLLEN